MDSNTQTILIVFVALTGLAVLMQACVLLGIFLSLKKTAKTVAEATGDIKATVFPFIQSTKELVERISPQVMTISAGLAELTETVQKESKGVRVSVTEIMDRVNRQTARLDTMLTVGLNKVEHTAGVLETAVATPVRQANGIFAAVKAAVEAYCAPAPRRSKAVYPDPNRDSARDPVRDPDRDFVI